MFRLSSELKVNPAGNLMGTILSRQPPLCFILPALFPGLSADAPARVGGWRV